VILAKRTTMTVALIMTLFLALIAIGAGKAFAADRPAIPAPAGPSHKDEDDKSEVELHHDKLREQYGEVEQVFLPPLVVTDPAGLGGEANQIGTPVGPNGELLDSANINPLENLPVDPTTISKDKQTPADSFFQLATAAIASMAAGSLALGAFAFRRTVKMRKSPDSDLSYK